MDALLMQTKGASAPTSRSASTPLLPPQLQEEILLNKPNGCYDSVPCQSCISRIPTSHRCQVLVPGSKIKDPELGSICGIAFCFQCQLRWGSEDRTKCKFHYNGGEGIARRHPFPREPPSTSSSVARNIKEEENPAPPPAPIASTAAAHAVEGANYAPPPPTFEDPLDLLKLYLQTNLEQFKLKEYRHLMAGRCAALHGQTRTPAPISIRGFSQSYTEVMRKLQQYMTWTNEEQKAFNKDYVQKTSRADKKKFKENVKFLNSSAAKKSAIDNLLGGSAIAQQVGYECDMSGPCQVVNEIEQAPEQEAGSGSVAEGSEREEEEIENVQPDFVGMFDTQERRAEFQAKRKDKRKHKSWKKPSLQDAPSDVRHLGRQICTRAEEMAVKNTAKYLDATFVKDPPPSAPKRTGVLLLLDECNHSSKSGGVVGNKNVRAKKPRMLIVANNSAECKYVMGKFFESFGRQEGNQHDEYETETIFRKENTSMRDSTRQIYGEKRQSRENPRRSCRSSREILGDILNISSS